MKMNTILTELNSIKENHLYRNITSLMGIDFCSNDYLGLIKKGIISTDISPFESGAGSSRLIPGNHNITKEIENLLSQIYNVESTLFFGSGYLANLGVLQAMGGDEVEFFSDELNHASIIDGIKLSKGKKKIYRHNDFSYLEEMLKKSSAQKKCIITESVFSMDGDSPAINELIEISERFAAFLIIDEAHATGVLGRSGLGLMEDFKYNKEKTIIIHTCGKAIGCYGAFVTSGNLIRELFINKARTLIYSTALPPALIRQIYFAINKIIVSDNERIKIGENIQYAKEEFQKMGLMLNGSHISYIKLLDKNTNLYEIDQKLKNKGFEVKAIRFPSVKKGEERLRITLKSFNSKKEIQALAYNIKEILE